MKQHLRIKEFYGTSENAVKIQIYSAITAYCLVALAERRLRLDMPTYTVLRILSLSLFEKVPLGELFKEYKEPDYQNDTQLYLNFFSVFGRMRYAPTVNSFIFTNLTKLFLLWTTTRKTFGGLLSRR